MYAERDELQSQIDALNAEVGMSAPCCYILILHWYKVSILQSAPLSALPE